MGPLSHSDGQISRKGRRKRKGVGGMYLFKGVFVGQMYLFIGVFVGEKCFITCLGPTSL